jgi:protein-tyrosine phosphatase
MLLHALQGAHLAYFRVQYSEVSIFAQSHQLCIVLTELDGTARDVQLACKDIIAFLDTALLAQLVRSL